MDIGVLVITWVGLLVLLAFTSRADAIEEPRTPRDDDEECPSTKRSRR